MTKKIQLICAQICSKQLYSNRELNMQQNFKGMFYIFAVYSSADFSDKKISCRNIALGKAMWNLHSIVFNGNPIHSSHWELWHILFNMDLKSTMQKKK